MNAASNTHAARTATNTHAARTKLTLFCPECRFESPADGEWIAVSTERNRKLVCPDCGTIVDERERNRSTVPCPAD